tara:strand:- start:205 stop:423 length:219 start_codon:yes stop_codon:yes gene_type:complete
VALKQQPMTRYALQLKKSYLAAYYTNLPKNGLYLTDKKEDACSFVTLERALRTACELKENLGAIPTVIEVSN